MSFLQTIENLKTVRDFRDDAVPSTILKRLINKTQSEKGLLPTPTFSVRLIEDGPGFFQYLNGKAGYFGNMIAAPHYIVLFDEPKTGAYENSGYVMEKLRLAAWEEELGTCWISLDEPADIAPWVADPVELPPMALVAIGYPESGIFIKDVLKKSARLSVADLVYLEKWNHECPMEELEVRGMTEIFYYGKLAPSWGNRQPWRFILHHEKVYLTIHIDEQEERARTDAGIVMLYIQQAAHDKGFSMNWQLLDKDPALSDEMGLPETDRLIGLFSFG